MDSEQLTGGQRERKKKKEKEREREKKRHVGVPEAEERKWD